MTELVFLGNEFIQLKANGALQYFSEFTNYVELLHHLLFFYFASLKAGDMHRTLMPPEKGTGTQILLINSFLALSAFAKIFTFFRAIPSMAKMVILMT